MLRFRRRRNHGSLTSIASGLNGGLLLLVLILLLANHAVSSSIPMDKQADELAKLPACTLTCLAKLCQLSNTTCICENEEQSRNDDCVLGACTLPEALFSNNLTKTTCQVEVRDQSVKFNIMVLTLGSIAASTVGIRLLFKQFCSARQRLESDDWTILSAIPLGLSCIVLTVAGLTAHGLGRDLWGVSHDDLLAFGRYFYVIQIIYIVLMAQIKLTLCFFYLNIFSGPIIRRLLWGTVVFHVLFTVAFVVGIIFQCTPIQYQWEKFDFTDGPLRGGHCININAAGWANGAISVASDFWLLAIPLSQVRRLKLHWKKKASVALMFLTGAIVTIISFLRLQSIVRYASTANPTWDLWGIVWWSAIEVCAGLICTCLPAMRLLLLRVAPRVFGSDSHIHRLPLKSPTPRQPEPPLCSGQTLASVRGHDPKVGNRVDTGHSQHIDHSDYDQANRSQEC